MAQNATIQREFDDEFTYFEEPQEDMKCPLCLDVFKEAHEVSTCGHVFCKKCIIKAKNESQRRYVFCKLVLL